MLVSFLTHNQKELIARCSAKVSERLEPLGTPSAAIEHGVPVFLRQLVDALRLEESTPAHDGAISDAVPSASAIGLAAASHGAELLRMGFSIDQVVREYGDVCQSVTELALERNFAISTTEFRILNRCLDDAIADAVNSFGVGRQKLVDDEAQTLQARLEFFAQEHGRLVDIAIEAYSAIKTGSVALNGATGNLLVHTLKELRSFPTRALPKFDELQIPDAAPVTAS